MTIPSKLPKLMVRPAHPNEILYEYIPGLTPEALSTILCCPIPQARQILYHNSSLTPPMCLRLAHYFDTSFEFWHNMQHYFDLSTLSIEEELIRQETDVLKQQEKK